MPDSVQFVQARRVRRVSITIPAAGGTAVTLQSLVIAALEAIAPGLGRFESENFLGGLVHEQATSILTYGDTATSLPLVVPTGSDYSEPATNFLRNTFTKSAGAAQGVVVSVWLAGDGQPGNLGG